MNKIKAVVFDYDGVMELKDISTVCVVGKFKELIGVTSEEWREVYCQHNHLSNIENVPWFDMVSIVARKLGATDVQIEEMRLISDENQKTARLNKELIEYIKNKLKPAGYLIGILSNNNTGLRERIKENHIDNILDVIVISAEEGYQKPHELIFESLFKKLNAKANEVVFIDDQSRPLEKAEIIGYTPILYKDFETFKQELEKVLEY